MIDAGLLKEFTAIIADDGTNIRSVDTKPTAGWERWWWTLWWRRWMCGT